MALMVEIDRLTLTTALEVALASAKRARNTTKKPEFLPIYEKDINILMTALASIQEVKVK